MLAPFDTHAAVPHFTYRWYADYVAQSVNHDRSVWSVDHQGRSFYFGRQDVPVAAEAMLGDVERLSEPGDQVIVGPGDLQRTPYSEAYLYYLLPQLVPGCYIEMDPGVANADDSGLADELRESDIVILSTMYDNWVEPNTSMDPGSAEPDQVLDETVLPARPLRENPAAGPGRPIFGSTSAVTDDGSSMTTVIEGLA